MLLTDQLKKDTATTWILTTNLFPARNTIQKKGIQYNRFYQGCGIGFHNNVDFRKSYTLYIG
ncbi:hypothetical protein, partial [Flavobacterium sp. ZT3R18]|uniref:hypothetical protein n=1 Tax=Flavobacterium sp. ZT3R18 TaxID=2594429 RepID=UPI001C8F845A